MAKKYCVLLVEDDQDNFDLVRILLEQAGCTVIGAETGQQALKSRVKHDKQGKETQGNI